jgi:hypothetical protein
MGGSNFSKELREYLMALMQNAYYSQVCINKFIQKVNPPPQSELAEPQNVAPPQRTPQPSTSQAEEGNQNKTHMTRGVKKILGVQMLKLMGRVSHGMKDMSEDMKTLTKDVGVLNGKIDRITAICDNPLGSKQGVTPF